MENSKKVKVLVYDAFTKCPGKGNPAGVVLNAEQLSVDDMQNIAKEVGYSETAFVFCDDDRYTLRFFMPGQEVPLCGHATIASMVALYEHGMISLGKHMIGTGVGLLEIEIKKEDDIMIGMQQDVYKEMVYNGSTDALAALIGLETEAIDTSYPVRYVNTGAWTLLVPIKRLSDFMLMKPDNKAFPEVLKENPKASVHPFCLETYDETCRMHGRHFSSPFSGTIEDPVTGTASGAMGMYYAKHIDGESLGKTISIEQGHEMGREGVVKVSIPNDLSGTVKICGTANKEK